MKKLNTGIFILAIAQTLSSTACLPTTIRGSLDKELIRRVIKRHISQIRYCYERQLQVNPGLNGKVRIEWVITAQGRVRSTKVMESTMGNVQVERCMMRKIRTWLFPKPKGGGIVIVTYPWVLKPTG